MRFGRLMCFWQSLRPHFLCRHCDRKFARRPPKPIASVVSGHSWKGKKRQICIEKSLRNCPFFDIDRLFGFDRFLTSDNFCGRTIPRRFSKEESWLFSFRTMTTKDRIGDFWFVRLSRLAGWKWFSEREKTYSTCFDWLFALAGWKCISIVRKKEKNLLDNPKEEKTRFGLVGRKVYRKVFSTFDLLVLTDFSWARQEIHKTCFETLILRVWILKIIR